MKILVDAENERQVSIYSPAFYSSKGGYKFCARFYPRGDGNVRNQYASLFLVVMRTENDALLDYPIKSKVTFCLMDQSETKHHHIDSFRPDPNSSSFKKPERSMNIASGIPKFAPIHFLTDEKSRFVRNNTIFIRIVVDFLDSSRALLRFAVTIDPGLPESVKQTLIENERRNSTNQ